MKKFPAISNIINGMRDDIENDVDDLVYRVATRAGQSSHAVREEVIRGLKRILDEAPGSSDDDSDDDDAQPELRAVRLTIDASMTIEAGSQAEVDDRADEIREAAEGYGISDIAITGDYDDGDVIDHDDADCGDEACNG